MNFVVMLNGIPLFRKLLKMTNTTTNKNYADNTKKKQKTKTKYAYFLFWYLERAIYSKADYFSSFFPFNVRIPINALLQSGALGYANFIQDTNTE